MRKCFCILLLMALLLCSCGSPTNNPASNVEIKQVSVRQLETLFDENMRCVEELLVLGALPHSADAVLHGHIYPVKSVEFQTLAELETYLKTVYTAKETERLLDADGSPLYLEVHGVLCVDTHRIGGKPYNVDWEKRKITIDSIDKDRCHFTVTGTQPAANNPEETESYTLSGSAVYENGKLVLEKILY